MYSVITDTVNKRKLKHLSYISLKNNVRKVGAIDKVSM